MNLEIASHLPIMYTTCSLCIALIDWVNWLNRALEVSIQSTAGRSNLNDAEEVLREYQVLLYPFSRAFVRNYCLLVCVRYFGVTTA